MEADDKEALCRQLADGKELADVKMPNSSSACCICPETFPRAKGQNHRFEALGLAEQWQKAYASKMLACSLQVTSLMLL